MRKGLIAVLATLLPALSIATTSATEAESAGSYVAVKGFTMLGGLHSFEPLDRTRLIVWRTASDPYLVELAFPSVDLKFARGIAIDSRTNRILSGFDSVRIGGIKYRIENIFKLTREQARAL